MYIALAILIISLSEYVFADSVGLDDTDTYQSNDNRPDSPQTVVNMVTGTRHGPGSTTAKV